MDIPERQELIQERFSEWRVLKEIAKVVRGQSFVQRHYNLKCSFRNH